MGEKGDKAIPKVYVWGQTGNNQLSVDSGELGYLVEPTLLSVPDPAVVRDAALGTSHSLILTDEGVLSTGCNASGQLGCDPCDNGADGRPAFVKGLPHKKVIAVAVGEVHSLALTDEGVLYSWGGNECGQLGRTQSTNDVRPVEFPAKCHITQVACGEYHNIALARDGAVYTWGSHQYGQLGHGRGGLYQKTPQCVQSIRSLHFVKIAAGGNHSFALTISGALFGWGRNSNGQLGLGNNENKAFPICCRALRQQRIKHVACGLSHTAALTKDGGVFTFGGGNNGQLGHGVAQDEYLPKKVMELMGSIVTQLSCGRYHTLSFVPSSGRVYSFGLGSYGQLGTGDTDKKTTPCRVKPAWSPPSSLAYSPRHIIAGGNSCLVIVYPQHVAIPSVDHRVIISTQTTLDKQYISEIISVSESATLKSSIECLILDIFRSISVWNGAFLSREGDEHGCSSTQHGIDLDLAKEQLSRISECKNVVVQQLIASNLEQHLTVYLKGKIPDVEALRIFLILPFLPMFAAPGNYATMQSAYGNALVNMDTAAANVIDKWLLHSPRRHFKYYLLTFRGVVSYVLTLPAASTGYEALVRQRGIQICLDVMQRLYKVNEADNGEHKVSYVDFYIPEISSNVDIAADYYHWLTNCKTDNNGQPLVSFCNYAFVFDAQAKTKLLHTDALIQMKQAIDHAHRLNIYHVFSGEIDPVHPCLVLTVSRSNIVADTLAALNSHGSADLKKPLKVQFKGEEAVDEGGVRKEFFLLIIKEVLDVKYGMFTHYDETRLLWFNSTTFEDDMSMYRLIGLLCGLAIYNITIIDLPFPVALYKKLLGKSVNLDDVRELDPILGKNLQDLLDYEGDDVEDLFGLSFSVTVSKLDQQVTVDLIANGSQLAVTNDNRQEYVQRYVSYLFNESVQGMFDAFYDGFHKVCGSNVLSFFHPVELQAMVVGNENYNWVALKENCEYKGEYSQVHPVIHMFWEAFFELSESKQKKFLRFLTGCDRIPTQGMESLKMVIQPMVSTDDHLPVAHTCFNVLDLPHYTTKDALRTKLLLAIEHSEGFGLV